MSQHLGHSTWDILRVRRPEGSAFTGKTPGGLACHYRVVRQFDRVPV